MVARGESRGEEREFGMDMCTLLYLLIKQKTNKDLPYSTGTSTQCYAEAWMGTAVWGE